jgi:hypothetical protein
MEAAMAVEIDLQPGERELALKWLASLSAKLGTKPDNADDMPWIDRFGVLLLHATALRPSPSSDERVKVKALVWERLSSKIWDASAVGGLYRIRYENETWTAFKYGGTFRADRGTEQEAKAAAQLDYETRILSALDLPGDERVDLRDSVIEDHETLIRDLTEYASFPILSKGTRARLARDAMLRAAAALRALQPHKGE